MKKTISLFFSAAIFIAACGEQNKATENEPKNDTGTSSEEAKDDQDNSAKEEEKVAKADANYVDGTPIEFVVLGDQVWTGKNMMVTKFSDGSPIKKANSAKEWTDAQKKKEPAYCYVNWNESESVGPFGYGILYNGYVFTSEKKICPRGWHLPSAAEFDALNSKYNSKQLKATFGWKESMEFGPGVGTDDFGFTFLGGGAVNDRGMMGTVNSNGNLGTGAVESGKHVAYQTDYMITRFRAIKGSLGDGINCRCIKDDSNTEELNQDYQKKGPVHYSMPDAE